MTDSTAPANNFTQLAIDFAFCPHVTQDDINDFSNLILDISLLLKMPVNIITFTSVEEGTKKLQTSEYHIIYADPHSTLELMKKGYILIGKLQMESEYICSVMSPSYNRDKDLIRIAMVKSPHSLLLFLVYQRDYRKVKPLLFNTYTELIQAIITGDADVGFVNSSLINKLKQKGNIKLSEEIKFPAPHFLLIHPSLSTYSEEFYKIQSITKCSEEEINFVKTLYEQLDQLLEQWSNYCMLQALVDSPFLAIIIYQDKVVYANDCATKLLGYTQEELLNMTPLDFIYEGDRTWVSENVRERLKGIPFSGDYQVRIVTKEGELKIVQSFAHTVFYKGEYSGLVVYYDITRQKHLEIANQILKVIYKTITTSLTEEEIYNGICDALADNFGFELVMFNICDEHGGITHTYYKGDGEIAQIFLKNKDSWIKKLKEDSIVFMSDIRKECAMNTLADELSQKGVVSACCIALLGYEGNLVSALHIVSSIPNFFRDIIKDIIEEIKRGVEFALTKVERIRTNTIISEALKNSDTWVLVTDEKGNIVYVNEAVEKISGYQREELLGQNPRIFKSGLNPPEFYKNMWETILSGQIFSSITPNRKKDGSIFVADLKIIPIQLPGGLLRFVAVAKDVTENVLLNERVNQLQKFDALTGLLNLKAFSAAVSMKLEEGQREGLLGVFILVDIFKMSLINQMLGFCGGDSVLADFAQRLKAAFPDNAIIGRIGADTFGLYLNIVSQAEIWQIYSKLSELGDLKILIEGKTVPLTINAGIAMSPKHGITFYSLYEKTEIALNKAKMEGGSIISFFDPELGNEISSQLNAYNLVRLAFEENLFVFYYQPYFYSNSLKIAGMEALVRIDYKGTLFYPNSFIDYLENSPFLERFENYLIKEAEKAVRMFGINISINISAKSFTNPLLIKKIEKISKDVRNRISIEITERAFMKDPDMTTYIILNLKKLDACPLISIDDFGTGYSSLVYLKDLPIDIIKIDISFIRDMLKDRTAFAVVQTIIDLAKRLEKLTLAEGVETKEQYEILKVMGCDMVQGFLFSKPLPEVTAKERFTNETSMAANWGK